MTGQKKIENARLREAARAKKNGAAACIQAGLRLWLRARGFYPAEGDTAAREDTWHECWDDEAQAYYYVSEATGEAVWDKPAALATDDVAEGAVVPSAILQTQVREETWTSYWDAEQAATYYYNVQTDEVSWDMPLVLQQQEEQQQQWAQTQAGVGGGQLTVQSEGGVAEWTEHWDAEAGSYYYFNERTEEAVWEKPAGFVAPPPAADAHGSGSELAVTSDTEQPEWAEHWDEEAGSYYYFNWKSEEAVWERPAGFVDTPASEEAVAIEPAAEDWAAAAAADASYGYGEAELQPEEQHAYGAAQQEGGEEEQAYYDFNQQEQEQEYHAYAQQQEYYEAEYQ